MNLSYKHISAQIPLAPINSPAGGAACFAAGLPAAADEGPAPPAPAAAAAAAGAGEAGGAGPPSRSACASISCVQGT
eukprot:1144916-Pelagomonas_calceolata.AAC.1